MLVDPTREEEELSKGTITVTCGDDEQLVSLYKPGKKLKIFKVFKIGPSKICGRQPLKKLK